MTFDIILDLVVVACLAATIAFAVRLNKKLSTLYESRKEVQAFLTQFTASMAKADASIKDLKGIGESVFKTAQEQMKVGEVLKEDLSFLNERGEELAERLENAIRLARNLQKSLDDSATTGPGNSSLRALPTATKGDNSEPALVRQLQNVR